MLNERLRELRISYKYSQVELSKLLNVSKQTLSNWENDNIRPSVEMLMNISKHFNVSTDYLLGLDNRKFVEISELSLECLAHIQQIINDIRKTNDG